METRAEIRDTAEIRGKAEIESKAEIRGKVKIRDKAGIRNKSGSRYIKIELNMLGVEQQINGMLKQCGVSSVENHIMKKYLIET